MATLPADVVALVVVDAGVGQAEAVADELDALPVTVCLPPALAGNVTPSPSLNVLVWPFTRHRDARVALDADAEQLHRLEVGAVVTRGLDAPFLQVVGDVAAGETETLGEDLPALQLVRRDV